MFSFFRKIGKKDTGIGIGTGTGTSTDTDITTNIDLSLSADRNLPSENVGSRATAENNLNKVVSVVQTVSKTEKQQWKEATRTGTGADVAVITTDIIMPPMIVARGKGKGKRKPPYHPHHQQQQQQSPPPPPPPVASSSPSTTTTTKTSSSLKEKPHKSAYSKILQRLDSTPITVPLQETEKRRHSVKPCSHVTIAATPNLPVAVGGIPTGNMGNTGSPVPAVRHFRGTKQPKTNPNPEQITADTVTAAIKLRIDLPKTLEESNSRILVKNSDNNCDTNNAYSNVNNVQSNNQDNSNHNNTRNLINQEAQLQAEIAKLSEQLQLRDAEVNDLRTQLENVQRELYVKSSAVERVEAELAAAHKESESIRLKLNHLQEEIEQYKQKIVELMQELEQKMNEKESLEVNSKAQINELDLSLSSLKDKMTTMEEQLRSSQAEREYLEALQNTMVNEREEERRIVQEALDAAASENDTMSRQWKLDFEKLRTLNTDREQKMLEDYEWKLREIHAACKKRLEEKDKQIEVKLKEMQNDVNNKLEMAEKQMNEVSHLKSYEAEVTQLRGLTHDQQHSLKTMSVRLEELQATEQNLHEEISKLHGAIEEEKRQQILLVQRHDKDLSDKERALQIRLDIQRGEIAVQWEQKLRQECARLTAELEQIHGDEKQLAVELVRLQKDREFESIKEKLNAKLQQQADEISQLKCFIQQKEQKHQIEIERLQTNMDRDIIELRRELDKSEMAFHERTEKLLDDHDKELEKLNEEAERRIKETEQSNQMQMSSMRTTLELVKEQAARETQQQIEKLKGEHQKIQEELWQRLSNEKQLFICQIEEEYKSKFEKIKEQFSKVQKSHQNQETDLRDKICELEKTLIDKSSAIECLQGNVDTLQGGVQVLRQEIVHQDSQISNIQKEADQKIGELQQALKVERNTLQVEREEHIQEIAHIQKQSQSNLEQLQRRCQCLTKLFEDIRARYDKRESRQEDLNLIADLRGIIAEQERDLAVLNEEKRYFQMKLLKKEGTASPSSPETDAWKDARIDLHDSSSRSSSVQHNLQSDSDSKSESEPAVSESESESNSESESASDSELNTTVISSNISK